MTASALLQSNQYAASGSAKSQASSDLGGNPGVKMLQMNGSRVFLRFASCMILQCPNSFIYEGPPVQILSCSVRKQRFHDSNDRRNVSAREICETLQKSALYWRQPGGPNPSISAKRLYTDFIRVMFSLPCIMCIHVHSCAFICIKLCVLELRVV